MRGGKGLEGEREGGWRMCLSPRHENREKERGGGGGGKEGRGGEGLRMKGKKRERDKERSRREEDIRQSKELKKTEKRSL